MKIELIIADDHQLFVNGLQSILDKEFDVHINGIANNGLELLKLLESGTKASLIITDIRMPIMDGISATKVISKDYPDIPVLALTMFDQSADVYEMLDAGAAGYITKEADQKELLQAIRTLVSGRNFFSKSLPINYEAWEKSKVIEENITLTRREKEIVALIAKGRTTLEIAGELRLSKFTIDTHRKNIHKKLGSKSNASLINYALKNLQ